MTLHAALLVALGGAAGSVLRHAVSEALSGAWPWGTLAVNVVGSLAIGVLAGAAVTGDARLLLVTGLLGGFTTFSAFSLEAVTLWQRAPWQATLYIGASVAAGIAGVALTTALGRRL